MIAPTGRFTPNFHVVRPLRPCRQPVRTGPEANVDLNILVELHGIEHAKGIPSMRKRNFKYAAVNALEC